MKIKKTSKFGKTLCKYHEKKLLEIEIWERMTNCDGCFFEHITKNIKKQYYCKKVKGGWWLFNSPYARLTFEMAYNLED